MDNPPTGILFYYKTEKKKYPNHTRIEDKVVEYANHCFERLFKMLETIAAALITHLGKKVLDKFWSSLQDGNAPVVDIRGDMDQTTSQAGRTQVRKMFTVPEYQEEELIVGNFYQDLVLELFTEMIEVPQVPLVLIVEEPQEQLFLFEADLDAGYEIYLPHGVYSFYVLLIDRDEDDLLDAPINAIGFPSRVELSHGDAAQREGIDAWELADDSPLEVTHGGPYLLDFVLIDADEIFDFPQSLSDLIGT